MRNKYFPLLLILVAVAFLIWLHYRHPADITVVPPPPDTGQSTMPAVTTVGSASVPPPNPSIPPNATSQADMADWNSNRLKQMEAASQEISNEWRTPIQFYGKVVDQDTNPVSEAEIDFSCNDLSQTGTSNYKSVSDNQGNFFIQGITGKLLTVSVSKTGYYSSKNDNDSFYYAGQNVNFVPDSFNPVIFHLRKKGEGESLIVADYPGMAHIAQLHHDGTPVELDLLTGKQVAAGSGQLKLELWRDVSVPNARVYDWKLQLSASGGGLLGTDEEFDFQAPQSGYQPSIVIDMPATNENWLPEISSKYYIQLANGDYGRIDFYLLPRNGVFTVRSAINPSGSRNLEPQ